MQGRSYHDPGVCPVCGREDCWNHLPNNLLRAIEHDGSINGWEFLIYGNTLPSKEFIEKLKPLIQKLSEYFNPTERDSCHAHALLSDEIPARIPTAILKNVWQLTRYYFPGFSWLFGNQPRTIYRRSSYAGFESWDISAITNTVLGNDRNGLYYGNMGSHKFNIEFRMADSTLNLKQITALRSVVRALVIRAVELSQIGIIKVDSDPQKWEKIKKADAAINDACRYNETQQITDEVKQIMKENAKELLEEIKHLLDIFEYDLIKALIEAPPRETGETTLTEIAIPKLSPLAKTVNALVVNKAITAESEPEAVAQIATLIGKSQEKVQAALKELGATWEPTIREFKVRA